MKYILSIFLFVQFNALTQSSEKATILISVADYSHKPIANDKVLFIGKKSKQTFFVITGTNGKAQLNLPSGEIYDIKIDALGDALEYNTLEIPSIPAGYAFAEMELLIEYMLPEMITLSNLQFETGKATIRPESIPQLNQLAEYLLRKSSMKISIAGHTDNVGNDASNLILSQQRADAVKNYLIAQKVQAERIKSLGFGSTKPVADNSSEAGRRQNRRTEIRVVTP